MSAKLWDSGIRLYEGKIKVRPDISLPSRLEGMGLKALRRAYIATDGRYEVTEVFRDNCVVFEEAQKWKQFGYLAYLEYQEPNGL